MAETVHLTLKMGGNNIKGESSQTSLDRKDTIECVAFEQAVATTRETGTAQATGRRLYEPIMIRKRIDSSTPLLAKSMTENQTGDATFKFFRPNPSGDGTTEQFYTITLKQARVNSIKQFVLNTLDEEASHLAPMEEIGFVFRTIEWTYTNGGVTHQDDWSANR
jgi:type VI secretion system secreted protein Hcp